MSGILGLWLDHLCSRRLQWLTSLVLTLAAWRTFLFGLLYSVPAPFLGGCPMVMVFPIPCCHYCNLGSTFMQQLLGFSCRNSDHATCYLASAAHWRQGSRRCDSILHISFLQNENYVDSAKFCYEFRTKPGPLWIPVTSASICLGWPAKSLFLGCYFQQGTPLGAFSTRTFSFRVHLHFYKLESLMCGVLPSGYLSYMPVRKARFPFNDCWGFAFFTLLVRHVKLATHLSVLNLAFFLSFCSFIGDSNESSEKIDCNAGSKCHLSVTFSYVLTRVLRTGWKASPLSNRFLVLR